MTAEERRKEERIKVRFPCDLASGRKRASGMVMDISAGGLSVAADTILDQGESVFVRLHPKGRASIDVEALVWNVRAVKRGGKGKASARLGLVLSEAPDEFLGLLKSKTPARVAKPPKPARSAKRRSPEADVAKEAEPVPETVLETPPPPAERRFRARVKQSGGNRTRTILVFATSAEDAAEKALAEVEPGWILLEVTSG
jgi:hypothetical protein